MASIILSDRATALSVTKVYQERLKKSAELVAKKELVSLSTAIDSAAVKGLDYVDFKLSTSVTKLSDNYRDIAIQIIENDIMAAGYDAKRVISKDAITGYEISWAEKTDTDPAEGGDDNGDNNGNEPTGDPEDGESDIQSPEDLRAALAENDEVELTLSEDLVFTAPVTVATGKKATIHLNDNITNDAQIAFQVNGGELVIDGEGEISGAGRAIVVQNGGSVTINGGTYTSTSAGQALASIGEGSTIIINDAEVNAQEAAAMAFDGATLEINGGKFNTVDNFVIGTNGTAGRGGNTIIVRDAKLIGNIQSNGYEACGIYIANNDNVIIEGNTEIAVEGGCGILMRAGNVTVKSGVKITTTDATENGWVGDNKTKMSQSGIIYHEAANYPGKEGMSLVVEEGVIINAADEAIEVISNEETPNVTIPAA